MKDNCQNIQEYEDGRSAEMEKFGIKVLRFRNYEVKNDSEKVISEIKNIVKERLKSPPSERSRRGGFRG